nr:TPA_asm: PolB-C [Pimephales minnow adintovirus]
MRRSRSFQFYDDRQLRDGDFKTHFLEKNTLALTHNKAYVRQSKCYSSASIEWLEYVKKTRNVDLHHALNHGEVSVGKFFLDGYYEQDGVRHGLEFNGCSWHGCSCRYEPYHRHPLSGLPYGVLRSQFDDKVEILQKAYGLQIEVMWECRWNKMKKTDPSVIDFMTGYNAPERLKPRDALFGGRTNAYKLYHKAAEGEKIRYLDFTSLYPFCQATKSYPIEHPQIIFQDFQSIENYFGIIKATVYPPRKLLHPVLPYRCQGKLMFPLCRTCAQEQNQTTSCSHNDHERALSGCWVSIELLKAVEKGYVIAKIDKVWHFPQRSNTLFAGYVKTFLRLKQQASGYPSNVRTDAEKEAYVSQYFEKEGIRLDPKQIRFNAAQRAITKLILNSLWGRFSLRENLPKTTLVSEPEDFTSIVFGNTESLSYFTFISDDVALVQHKPGKDDLCKTRDVNVFIGAFTTAYARLELYELMDRLGDRLLYSDTDSVIFVSREGDWEPPLGDHLGELTSEVDEDDFVSCFCSSAPKSYAFETAKGKTCMKAKGITLNAKNSRVINMESLIGLVEGYVTSQDSSKHILAHSENIVRHKKTLTLHNKSVVKSFKVVYNKRRLLPDFTTLPYGY